MRKLALQCTKSIISYVVNFFLEVFGILDRDDMDIIAVWIHMKTE